MFSALKLVRHWKEGQFIPGGKVPQPSDDNIKEERLSELINDDAIIHDITYGIYVLSTVMEAFQKTHEFRRNSTSYTGNTHDLLMTDDFLLVAYVLRQIVPEGMVSSLREEVGSILGRRKRDEDGEDIDIQYNDTAPGNRPILTPRLKKPKPDLSEKWSSGMPPDGPFAGRSEPQQKKATGTRGIFSTTGLKQKATGTLFSASSSNPQAGGIFGTQGEHKATSGPFTSKIGFAST
ncbi:hypothetical protein FBEOM_14743, partial [Fusarium beomiforme]